VEQRKRLESKVPYNDLDLSEWKRYEEVWTDSLWLIPSRARGNGHALEYHGNFVPQIATQAFLRFTRAEDVVLDLFLGSGTSAVEALRLGRRCIGVELKAELVEHVRKKLEGEEGRAHVICGDSAAPETGEAVRAALAAWERDLADLLVLHPPYADIIRFSDREEDLSNAGSTEAFLALFRRIAAQGYGLLRPGRFAVLVIGDKYEDGELVPLGFRCMEIMNALGFRTKSIVVKNIEGNEVGKGRSSNLWRYRALRGGFYIFKHEYVMIFDKPRAGGSHRGTEDTE
jgi:DNA modification methylase